MKTVILSMLVVILIAVSFIVGLLVGFYYTTVPILSVIGNTFDTSDYHSGEVLVLIKDTKGIIFRKFISTGELINFVDGLEERPK